MKPTRGFTLVELLIGITIGLIVVGGAITLFVSIAKATTVMVQTNKMQQELRSLGLTMTRDIRRAGFSGVVPGLDFNGDGFPHASQSASEQMNAVRADVLWNPYMVGTADVGVYSFAGTDDCILFSYNADANLPPANTAAVVEADEWFGYRRAIVSGRGQIQMKTAGAAPVDCSSGTWETVTANEVDVTHLAFTLNTKEIEIENLSGGSVGVCEVGDSCQCIRNVGIEVETQLNRDSTVNSKLVDSVTIKNDKIVSVRSGNPNCHD